MQREGLRRRRRRRRIERIEVDGGIGRMFGRGDVLGVEGRVLIRIMMRCQGL